ncbi:MAG: ATP-binding protein [Treponemataceae bacterium]
MRLTFFFSTISFCFLTVMGVFTFFRGRFPAYRTTLGSIGRRKALETTFILFCALLALWALGTALFISSGTEEEALFWFRAFAFSCFFAPGVFVVFTFALSGMRLRLPLVLVPLLPGAAIFLANVIDPSSIVSSATPIAGGWHVVYTDSVWNFLNLVNTVGLSFFAALVLARTTVFSAYKRCRAQTGVVLAFFAPTFFCSLAMSVVARRIGVTDLPPLTPSFFSFFVIGLSIALFRYEMLELTPFTAADRIIASVTDAVALISVDGTVVGSNLSGSARGASLVRFVSEAEEGTIWLERKSVGGSVEFESKFAFKENEFVPASIRVRKVSDGVGAVFGYVLAARDLSTEKSLEKESALSSARAQALRSAEDNFARVFRACPAGMIISEIPTSQVLDVNDRVCAFLGRSREDLIGQNLWSLGYSMAPDMLDSMRTAVRKGLLVDTREVSMSRNDGTPVVFAVAAVPIVFAEKKSVLISFIDISELTFLRIELFNARKMESIGVMAAGLAHDFNNILTAIMGNVSLARLSIDETGDVSDALKSAETACARARDLSRQLLLFARGGIPSAQSLDLFALVLETTRMAISGTAVFATFECDPDIPHSTVDREQISMVFNNLALYAVQSMPSGGSLKVRGYRLRIDRLDTMNRAPGEYVCVEFTDEGPGIGPEYMPRVFDPYVSMLRKNGGLGLAVCDSIVKYHGGWMLVKSELGKGSVFTVCLPASPRESAALIPVPSPSDHALHKGKGSILVMDDEFAIRTMVSRLLSRLGYEATTVADGEAAVAAFKEARSGGKAFRAVILDLTIPGGMNGVDAASIIRSIDSSALIFISSGYESDPVLNDYAFYGFSGVIPKPYSLEELSARLSIVR